MKQFLQRLTYCKVKFEVCGMVTVDKTLLSSVKKKKINPIGYTVNYTTYIFTVYMCIPVVYLRFFLKGDIYWLITLAIQFTCFYFLVIMYNSIKINQMRIKLLILIHSLKL
jgi:hypothetical protein